MSKKFLSILLALCMLASTLAVCAVTTNAATTDADTVSASQGPQEKVQGSAILHCFNWSYNSIKNNLQAIKDAGYTAVQTSPVQSPKDYNASWTDQEGQWWKLYQPIDIRISDYTWLGTKAQLKSLCDAAEAMGIKVIVDVVANHLAGEGPGFSNINSGIESGLKKAEYFHDYNDWANDYDRYAMTMGHIDMPDLNTGHTDIQTYYKNFLIDCINQGVDGFRFDAAKHIELPTDSGNSSQFWPTVINGSQASTSNEIFYYGEILNGCATSITNYTQYMSITDNYSSDAILVAANNSNAAGMANSYYSKGAAPNKNVSWVESHDTYMGTSGSAGLSNTSDVSDSNVIKAWAMVGSRADASSLFFARPATKMGSASTNTTWKSTAVAEVNKFKNYFDGQTEYLSSSGSIAYNERGTSGVVLVNASGTSTSVNVTANKMKDGTYTDQITGNKFTVSSGKISGQIGSTGVAVVYNATPDGPSASVTPGSKNYSTDTLTLTLKYENATSGQYSIDDGTYNTFTNGQTITIGSGLDYGTKTTVSVKASNGTTSSEVLSYTYTKVDPSLVQKVYFDNTSYNWSSVYAYMYNDDLIQNADWPGVKMTYDSATGYYVAEVPDDLANGYVIFTESTTATTNRYPADGEDGMVLSGKSMLMGANHSWTEYTAQVTTTTTPATTAPVTTEPTTTVPDEKILIGDVTLDGSITVSDATEVQMYCTELTELTSNAITAADVNVDGRVNIKDATAIQCYLAEITNLSGSCGKYVGEVEEPTTQPTTTPVTDNYLYYKNSNGWSVVNAYYWSTGNTTMTSWPGTRMTSVGNNVYRVEVPADAENIIFNNGVAQTDDIVIDGMNKIWQNGAWSDYDPSDVDTTDPTIPSSDYTVTFSNSLNWSGTICCYYWSEASMPVTWPGVSMKSAGTNSMGQAQYTITIPSGVEYLIFTDGNNQTVNIPFDGTALNFYAESETDESGNYTYGTW